MDITKTYFNSGLEVDKIIGVVQGTMIVPAVSAVDGFLTFTQSVATGITESTFFQGVYSSDGGYTWDDFNSIKIDNVIPGQPFFGLQVTAYSIASSIVILANNYYNYGSSKSYAYNIIYKIALIARPNQGTIDPQPIPDNIYFDSGKNYQKIAFELTENLNTPSAVAQNFTFAHNLGYIPRYRLFIQKDNQLGTTAGLYDASYGNFRYNYCDTSNIYYQYTGSTSSGNLTGKVYARIYHDA